MSHSLDHFTNLPAVAVPPMPPAAMAKVNKSCLECTRRKVRCDGCQPCGSCVYYRKAESCAYRQRSRRNAVSRSTFDKASELLHSHEQILSTLFPGVNPAALANKSQHELLGMLPAYLGQDSALPGSATNSGVAVGEDASFPPGHGADDSEPISENGEPQEERHWEESLEQGGTAASDDVNAISLATDHGPRSYLGSTSMSAVLSTVFRLCPASKEFAAQCSKTWAGPSSRVQPTPSFIVKDPTLSLLKEQRCIDFYFEHLHAITPLLDEDEFRTQYASGTRQDPSWMALLNMVLAMGAIASGSDSLHEQYYRQARSLMSLDCLGAGNLEMLQALCILGGAYLHYRNSPNMAYGVLGAAHRVAIALGLHREPRRQVPLSDPVEAERHGRRLETRRRTWWSLFCLDTWATMTQGRPTCGRWDSTTMDTPLPQPLHPQEYVALSLEASVRFCVILDRIQHRYAQPGRLTTAEILDFDTDLVVWFENIPDVVIRSSSAPPQLNIAREHIRNRYYNVRVILGRSYILYLAHDQIRKKEDMVSENQRMLDVWSRVACEAIDAIALYWTPNRIHVWNSGWSLFQVCTIPLLLLALEKNVTRQPPPESVAAWRGSLSKALETFEDMRPWMRTSDRSPDIVAALFEVLTSDSDGLNQTPSATDGSNLDLFGWCDEQLTELDWGVFLGDQSLVPGMLPTM